MIFSQYFYIFEIKKMEKYDACKTGEEIRIVFEELIQNFFGNKSNILMHDIISGATNKLEELAETPAIVFDIHKTICVRGEINNRTWFVDGEKFKKKLAEMFYNKDKGTSLDSLKKLGY